MYKIHPTGHRVLVRIKKYEEISKGGLVIASGFSRTEHTKALQEATVIEIGPQAFKGFDDGKPWCKVDDLVMITKYCGEDRKDEETGEIYRVINDEDILAVLEE